MAFSLLPRNVISWAGLGLAVASAFAAKKNQGTMFWSGIGLSFAGGLIEAAEDDEAVVIEPTTRSIADRAATYSNPYDALLRGTRG